MSHLVSPVRALAAALATLLLAPLLALAATAVSPTAAAAAATPVALTVEEQAHLDLIQAHRQARGLPPVRVDARVQSDARAWARTMRDRGTLAHDPALRDACYAASSTCRGWAENVGAAGDHARVFELFTGSAGHRRNLENAAGDIHVGVAVLRDGGRTWVVERFMRCDCQNDALATEMNRDRSNALAFARALHDDFLGSAGTAASLDVVAAPLAYGTDRRALVQGLAFSDAWIGAMVDHFYRSTLGRAPDAAGRAFWVERIRSGHSPASVAAHFYGSDEYRQSVGGTDRAWIESLYQALLGRTGDAAGVRHWVDRVRLGTPRHGVALDFFQSVESRSVRVRALYDLLLGRQPDADGLIHWIFRLADGQDVRLAVDLAGSAEYLSRAIQRFG